VELLQMQKHGTTVAEYWTELPSKAELEQHLHQALIEAREWLARRGVLLEGVRMSDERHRMEFTVVALTGVGHMPAPGEDEKEAARVFYVTATRATQRLVIAASRSPGFVHRLGGTPVGLQLQE
jgi:superfamily I DNA/RNA helicase